MPLPAECTTVSRRSVLALAGVGAAGAALAGAGRLSRETTQPASGAPADLNGAGFYRARLGEFELFLISDGAFPFSDPRAILAANAQPAEVEAALRDAFLKPAEVAGQVNTLLVRTPDAVVLVDTGCGELFGPTTGKLVTNMARAGFTPADVDAVVLTHAHGDHLGGLVSGPTAAAFTKARFLASRIEHDFWRGPTPDLSRSILPKETLASFIASANRAFDAMTPRLDLIADGDQIAPGIHAVLLPGHTPGHIGVRVASGSDQMMFVSDIIHHVAFGMTNPEWHVAFDADPAEGSKTRRATLERLASDRALISGSHLPFPAFGHVRTQGKGYQFAPAFWTW